MLMSSQPLPIGRRKIGAFGPGDPEGDAVLGEMVALRFRRPPWNFSLQFLHQWFPSETVILEEDHCMRIRVRFRQEKPPDTLFWADNWNYGSPLLQPDPYALDGGQPGDRGRSLRHALDTAGEVITRFHCFT